MESSIFTAEACAIDLALDIISKEKHKKFIIFSDSLSVLLSLNNKKNKSTHLLSNYFADYTQHQTKESFFAGFQTTLG